jgi:hypothetical protein
LLVARLAVQTGELRALNGEKPMSFVDYLRLAQAITSIVWMCFIAYGFGFFDWFRRK